jgi:hypothetical protein
MILYYTKLNLRQRNCSWVVSLKRNINFKFQPPPKFQFLGFHGHCPIKSYLFFEDVLTYRIIWSHVDCCKFCTNIWIVNVCHFGIVDATRLKSMALRVRSVACPPYWISEESISWFKSNYGGHRLNADLTSLTFLIKDSRLKLRLLTRFWSTVDWCCEKLLLQSDLFINCV